MNKLLRIICSVFIFIAMVFQGAGVYAKNAALSSITISDNANTGYNVVLNIDKPIRYETGKLSNDKIILKIKNTSPAQNMNTLYQNASNLDHVMVKSFANNTIIEINGLAAAQSNIVLTNGTAKSPHFLWQIALLLIIGIVALCLRRNSHKRYSTIISIADEESNILKVAFERKGGLIAKGTGTKRVQSKPATNVRKVTFDDENIMRELNIR